jgi:hypothetical protein
VALAAIMLCACVVAACGTAGNGDVIAQFSGRTGDANGSAMTGHFSPTGAWDLRYSWSCARARSEGLADAHGVDLVVYNADDDSTSFENPEASSRAMHGAGVLHYHRSGEFYIGLQTNCDWQVDVVDRS